MREQREIGGLWTGRGRFNVWFESREGKRDVNVVERDVECGGVVRERVERVEGHDRFRKNREQNGLEIG